jgi:hypothetical protein
MFRAEMSGLFDRKSLPAPEVLELKVGAQVMMTANAKDKAFVNGTVGRVVRMKSEDGIPAVTVVTTDNRTVVVKPYTWEVTKYRFDERKRQITADTVGTFYQLPMMLAWAVTIHKSQGKTFDRVVVDLSRGTFAHGQTYVALSRCTTLNGLVFTKPIKKGHILLDWRIVKFLTTHQYNQAHEIQSLTVVEEILKEALEDHGSVHMTYLKASNVKSKRVFEPQEMGKFEYLGKWFYGVRGFDQLRGEERVFRIDRILEIKLANG